MENEICKICEGESSPAHLCINCDKYVCQDCFNFEEEICFNCENLTTNKNKHMSNFERRKERIILDLEDLKDERYLNSHSKDVIEDVIRKLNEQYMYSTED